MSMLDSFIDSYLEKFPYEAPEFDEGLLGFIEKTKYLLLDEKMSPSSELREKLQGLHVRAIEPMKVAIAGQFSSGKSTFLNALLSKNILPTGITPVTSKVNYIRYGDELKIRVHYNDGRDEYQSVEHISRFTDQREDVEDIEYLTLYAPLEMLREITFVDTPGLNSQDSSDTSTTQNVLGEVDGIIWLSLMDNAGKLSEAETLAKYLDQYQGKSLCVLNQKDKFTKEQIEQSVSYVKQSFGKFFSEVVPISAKQALKSRSHDKAMLVDEELDKFLSSLQKEIKSGSMTDISGAYDAYRKRVDNILLADLSKNLNLLNESNIERVLDFINEHIRPVAHSSKEFAIRRDIDQVCTKLIEQQEIFLKIYDDLSIELQEFEDEANEILTKLQEQFGKQLNDAYAKIEEIIDVIADNIYSHIRSVNRTRYSAKKSGLLKNSISYIPVEYKVSKIDSDVIYKYLFFDDDVIGKMFKKYVKNLKEIQHEVNDNNAIVYDMLKKRIRQWQRPYELIQRQEPLHSPMEFANIRKFASKAYENILRPFSDEIHSSYAKISSEFNHLSSAVSFNYQNATQVSIAFLEQKIEQSISLYEQDPTQFSLFVPKLEEIKDRLGRSFHLYELQNMMNSKKTFLSKNYDRLMREFKTIHQERCEFIQKRKARHERAVCLLDEYIEQNSKAE